MRFALMLPLILLAGCGSLVPATVAMLYGASPLEADPAAIQIALVMPPGLRVKPGTAKMTIATTRLDTNETRGGDFILQARPVVLAEVDVPEGAHSDAYRLSPKDVMAVKALQAVARQWKAEVPEGQTKGTFAVGVGGCTMGAGPAPDATASIYIRTEADGSFLPLLRDAELREFLGEELFAALGPCDGAK